MLIHLNGARTFPGFVPEIGERSPDVVGAEEKENA
jgi:hypothetical protein